jgi:GxxExxY protein
MEYLYSEETYKIRGAIYEVYKEIESGFLEAVYQECLEKEFKLQGVPFIPQYELELEYKGEVLKQKYFPDFLCYGEIIVELKAVKELAAEHQAQGINYVKASGIELGILVNFGCYPKAEIKRLIYKYQ